MRIALIGLGEAGRCYGEALVELGEDVVGIDPVASGNGPVPRARTIAEAVGDADLVLSMTGASAAATVAREALGAMRKGAIYADFTASGPRVMADLASEFAEGGVHFVDVAILGPIPWYGARTPLLIAGSSGDVLASLGERLGADVTLLDAPAGAAMSHKLLRSIFMKGLASLIWEAAEAGRAAGHEAWIRDQIARQLAGDGQAVIDRLLGGTVTHAGRRADEMQGVVEYLEDLDVPHAMSSATLASHRRIAGQGSVA